MRRVFNDKIWADTCSSTDITLHGSGRAVGKSGIVLQFEKAAESSDFDLTCHVFSIENAVAHLDSSDSSGSGGIKTIER